MTEGAVPDLDAFSQCFRTLTGNHPFAWQSRLYAECFAAGDLPEGCDIPTGLGKTAVMAVWLAARRLGAPVPRRLVYVVDRRAVVDQATRFATTIAGAGVAVSTLRGQHADEGFWLERPGGEAIIVGTVDMIGSRLLFEGYGIGRGMRPYHAGLLGADTLFVLDEAHLCPPFEALLRTIADGAAFRPEGEGRRAIIPPLRLLALSATSRGGARKVFRLQPPDHDPRDQPVVHERLTAAKHLAIRDLDPDGKLEKALAGRAVELGGADRRVIVFCHSRQTARKIAGELKKQAVQLIVGARRVRERQELEAWLGRHRFIDPPAGDQPPAASAPAFVVATAAGEVGIDIDADHMVCDLVAFERMVQRLGRVNRRGGDGRVALVDVFVEPPPAGKASEKEDAAKKRLEAAARLACWRQALAALPPAGDGRVDASPLSVAALKAAAPEATAAATTKAPLHPPLDRPLLDAWSMTALREHPGRPDITPWLRGWEEDEDGPQARLAWRSLLPWPAGTDLPEPAMVDAFFEAAPVHASELLEAPAREALDVLVKRAKAWLEAASKAENGTQPRTRAGIILLDWAQEFRGALTADEIAALAGPKQQRARDDLLATMGNGFVIVAAALGGLDDHGLLDPDAGREPPCADAPGATDSWQPAPEFRVTIAEADAEPAAEATAGGPAWRETFALPLAEGDAAAHLVVETLRDGRATRGNRAVSRRAQSLAEHGEWTAEAAEEIARALALDPPCRDMLVAAARLHDRGKARERWQRAMAAPLDGRPYAKTGGGGNPRLLEIAGHTYRHEFGSLRDCADDPALRALPEDMRDLALHLIAAHHGWARPVIAPVDPEEPPSASAARAAEVALRFARLQRQWGPWGLAWWEALLRAADWAASARNDGGGENG
ncbi:MAG: hypothetical protein OHK0024_28380 [Thalassobaculales bacterium]